MAIAATGPSRGIAICLLSATVLLASGCGGGSSVDLPVTKVARRLPAVRGLHFKRIPEVRLVSRSDYQKAARRELAAEESRLPAPDRARMRRRQSEIPVSRDLAVLLGLLPHRPSTREIDQVVQFGGLYDGRANRIYLIQDAIGHDRRAAEVVLSHELTHALEEESFGPGRSQFTSAFAEAGDAEQALREGTATLTETRYGIRYLGVKGPVSALLQPAPQPFTTNRLALLANKDVAFLYSSGALFAEALYRRGGWPLVNRALRHPPRTEATILDPRRWPGRDRSRPPSGSAGAVLRNGWTRTVAGDFGAFSTDELLFETAPREALDRLVRHWAGGRIELWRRRGAPATTGSPSRRSSTVVVQWRWRGSADTPAARAAVGAYLVGTFHAAAVARDAWRWGDGAAAYASSGDSSALVLAPTPGLASAVAAPTARP